MLNLRFRRDLEGLEINSVQPLMAPVEGLTLDDARELAPPPQQLLEVEIISDFEDPYLELVRLLKEATEIEHSLMVQYLFGAFSIKDIYPDVRGFSFSDSSSLLGVAIQEMEHLHKVNAFLIHLNAAPNLSREDLPWEPAIYPFPLQLQPLSKVAAAKYTFAEAPNEVFDPAHPMFDPSISAELEATLGPGSKINHLGSLYGRIINLAEEVELNRPAGVSSLSNHILQMKAVRDNGELDHFAFFKSVFRGNHPGFNGVDVWSLSPSDPAYPAIAFPVDPTALDDSLKPDLAVWSMSRLSNLHYWVIAMLLTLSYRYNLPSLVQLSKAHMIGPLTDLGTRLAQKGHGLPFDVLSLGYLPGRDQQSGISMLSRLLDETDRHIANHPDGLTGFDNSQSARTRNKLASL